MKIEYEIRVLEINKEEIINKLEKLGATKIGEFNQKRYVYDLKPVQENKWIRLRTNGIKTTLTYKDIEICHNTQGKPFVLLKNKARAILMDPGEEMHISISHDGNYAIAFAMIK